MLLHSDLWKRRNNKLMRWKPPNVVPTQSSNSDSSLGLYFSKHVVSLADIHGLVVNPQAWKKTHTSVTTCLFTQNASTPAMKPALTVDVETSGTLCDTAVGARPAEEGEPVLSPPGDLRLRVALDLARQGHAGADVRGHIWRLLGEPGRGCWVQG